MIGYFSGDEDNAEDKLEVDNESDFPDFFSAMTGYFSGDEDNAEDKLDIEVDDESDFPEYFDVPRSLKPELTNWALESLQKILELSVAHRQ